MSESDIPIIIEFEGNLRLKAVLDRVKAPLIIEEIKSMLPVEGKAAFLRGEMKITLGINKGNLKPTKNVKRGEIAYMPLGDTLCIYLQDMSTFSQVNVIGHVTSDESLLDSLTGVRRGSQAKISLDA
ncbi:MAG: cyclophilin-like fold protein [Candidatus Thorarchaeota archaeon]